MSDGDLGTPPSAARGRAAWLGPYRLVDRLGGGGMGIVYRAEHAWLRRPAAVKVLRPELRRCPRAAERFLAEACATASIRHAGVVEVYDYGHADTGDAFLAMELLDGQTVGAHVAARGRLSVFDAMLVARRIAVPLAAAHARGIVHRDLKPDNVFLVRGGGGALDRVKLLDFGVALQRGASAGPALIAGTPAYMAPEQCRGDAASDHRADLYALGCLMFELLTGAPPYGHGPAPDLLLEAHLHAPVPEVGRCLALPAEIAALVGRLLAKRAIERPGSALEVIAEIDRWLYARELVQPAWRGARDVVRAFGRGLASSVGELGVRVRAWRSGVAVPRVAPEPANEPANEEVPAAAPAWPSIPWGGTAAEPVRTSAPTLAMGPPSPGPASTLLARTSDSLAISPVGRAGRPQPGAREPAPEPPCDHSDAERPFSGN